MIIDIYRPVINKNVIFLWITNREVPYAANNDIDGFLFLANYRDAGWQSWY